MGEAMKDRAEMVERVANMLRREIVNKKKPCRFRIEATHGGEGLVILAIIEPVPEPREKPPDDAQGGRIGPNGGPAR